MVGNVQIGGQNKVVIQSMCNTKTKDIDSTEGNKVQGEDDMGSADLLLSIKTGQVATILFVVFIGIAIVGTVAYIIIKREDKIRQARPPVGACGDAIASVESHAAFVQRE